MSPTAPGAPCARTTAATATRGATSPTRHARSRVYRWNEDGIAGICNRHQNICLAFAFWNGVDRILKERYFGVTGHEGNHAEDVKEYYFHLDGLPSHAYMKMLYVYPQVAYPYEQLLSEGAKRGTDDPELELVDVIGDALREGRYFDIVIEHAKVSQDDLVVRITARNRGPEAAPLHVLPQLWFPNTWAWGHDDRRPTLAAAQGDAIRADERHLGTRWMWARSDRDPNPALLFTENETNRERVYQQANTHEYVKGRLPRRRRGRAPRGGQPGVRRHQGGLSLSRASPGGWAAHGGRTTG